MTDPITLQWTPTTNLPRKVTFEPTDEGYRRTEYEWNGTTWRHCGNEHVTNCTLTPTDPPTLEELLSTILDTWTTTDPQVLVFDLTPTTTDHNVIAAVDGEFRHRNTKTDTYHAVTSDAITHHAQHHGLPTVRPLSTTPYDRTHFTTSSLLDS